MKPLLCISESNTAISYYRHWMLAKQLGFTSTSEAAFAEYGYVCSEGKLTDSSSNYDTRWLNSHLLEHSGIWSLLPLEPHRLAYLLALREWSGLPLLIDIDDLVFDIPVTNQAGDLIRKRSDREKIAAAALKAADLVTTTCSHLAKYIGQHNSNVLVLPNCVEPALWEYPRTPHPANEVRILWAGSTARYADLLEIQEPLEWLHDRYASRSSLKVKLIFLASCPSFAVPWVDEGFAYVTKWTPLPLYATLTRHISPDIGLAPLVPNEFNRCKSNLKYLEYAMMGAAGVYTDETTYSSVCHGETGLLARAPEDWKVALQQLIEDASLRHSIISASRADTLDRFNIVTSAPRYLASLKEALSVRSNRSIERHARRPSASAVR